MADKPRSQAPPVTGPPITDAVFLRSVFIPPQPATLARNGKQVYATEGISWQPIATGWNHTQTHGTYVEDLRGHCSVVD
jgi:hypothetical protein